MKIRIKIFLIVIILVVVSGCRNQNKPPDSAGLGIDDTTLVVSPPVSRLDSTLQLINMCKNRAYEAKLEEFVNLDSNAFLLTIASKNSNEVLSLDLPTGRTHIEKCSDNYILLWSACGGPCFGLDFIFIKEKRLPEDYVYCHIAKSNDNIITHIDNEEFENLKIRNLKNSKEITVNLGTCENVNSYPCGIIGIDISGNMLKIEIDSSGATPRQVQINIREILR